MTEANKFTLAESLEARDAIAKEFTNMLGVAFLDVSDVYGREYRAEDNIFWDSDRNDTAFAKQFAKMLVDRLLWSRDYGIILDYEPDAINARKIPTPQAAQIFGAGRAIGISGKDVISFNETVQLLDDAAPNFSDLSTAEFQRLYMDGPTWDSEMEEYGAFCDACDGDTYNGHESVTEDWMIDHANAHIEGKI